MSFHFPNNYYGYAPQPYSPAHHPSPTPAIAHQSPYLPQHYPVPAHMYQPHSPYSSAPVPAPDYEAEERAALAHLRSIQQRRSEIEAAAAIRRHEEEQVHHRQQQQAFHATLLREVEKAKEIAVALRLEKERKRAMALAMHQRQQRQEYQRRQEEALAVVLAQRQHAAEKAIQRREVIERVQRELTERTEQNVLEHQRRRERARQQAMEQHHRARQLYQQQHELEMRKKACAQHCARSVCTCHLNLKKGDVDGGDRSQHATAPPTSAPPKEISDLLATLFGVDFAKAAAGQASPDEKTNASKQEQAATTAPAEQVAAAAAAEKFTTATPKNADAASKATAPAPKVTTPATQPITNAEAAFPENLNDLLTHFLGLRVDPTSSETKPTGDNAVPAGLNEFLSQFGMEFEPLAHPVGAPTTEEKKDEPTVTAKKVEFAPIEKVAAPAPTASTSARPAPANAAPPAYNDASDHPLTSFLVSVTNLPPFVRDILQNVEVAFAESAKESLSKKEEEVPAKQDKGKGVAEGEKKSVQVPTTPAPVAVQPAAPAAAPAQPTTDEPKSESETKSTSMTTLSSIASELDLVQKSFTFSTHLSFSTNPSLTESTTSSNSPAPALLFNRTNRPYHSQNHKLLQLLLQADGIASAGDKEVPEVRKEVVKAVEGAIEGLEKRRDEVWKEVLERRERGDGEGESDVESLGSSVEDHHHVEAEVEPQQQDEMGVTHFEDVKAVEEKEAGEQAAAATETATDSSEEPATTSSEELKASEAVADSKAATVEDEVNNDDLKENVEVNVDEKKAEPAVTSDNGVKVDEKENKGDEEKDEGYELL